jgi:GT2 family glycosyltransferase
MVAFGGGRAWVSRALDELGQNTEEAFEVIVVDNGGSEDGDIPDDDRNVEVVRNNENVGFGVASNQGAARVRGDVLCFLNTDALVQPGWLPPLLERIREPSVGAVFPAKLNLDGTMQEAGAFVTGQAHSYVFGDGDDADHPQYRFPRDVDFGSAAAMCTTRRLFESVGGFDPVYRLAYFEDTDLCFRLRQRNLRAVFEPRSRVTHGRTVSATPADLADIYAANREVFLTRWRPLIEQRPSFDRLQADPRARLTARDFHAPDRVLLLGSAAETFALAKDLVSAHPRLRVTLLVSEIDTRRERELLESGVEVARPEHTHAWLKEREGHYSHILSPQDANWFQLRRSLRETQAQALFVDVSEIEDPLRREPLTAFTSRFGIAR